jgi:hypothetical protein
MSETSTTAHEKGLERHPSTDPENGYQLATLKPYRYALLPSELHSGFKYLRGRSPRVFCSLSGPVRGFAVTLGAEIVTILFTAFSLTRMIIVWWVWEFRPVASLSDIGESNDNKQ